MNYARFNAHKYGRGGTAAIALGTYHSLSACVFGRFCGGSYWEISQVVPTTGMGARSCRSLDWLEFCPPAEAAYLTPDRQQYRACMLPFGASSSHCSCLKVQKGLLTHPSTSVKEDVIPGGQLPLGWSHKMNNSSVMAREQGLFAFLLQKNEFFFSAAGTVWSNSHPVAAPGQSPTRAVVIQTASRVRLAVAAACPEAALLRTIATALQPAGP